MCQRKPYSNMYTDVAAGRWWVSMAPFSLDILWWVYWPHCALQKTWSHSTLKLKKFSKFNPAKFRGNSTHQVPNNHEVVFRIFLFCYRQGIVGHRGVIFVVCGSWQSESCYRHQFNHCTLLTRMVTCESIMPVWVIIKGCYEYSEVCLVDSVHHNAISIKGLQISMDEHADRIHMST